MDPLSALRYFTVQNKLDQIVRINDEYRFAADFTFPSSIETSYKSKYCHGNRYTLETLVFFIKNYHLKHTEYIQTCCAQRIQYVTLPDRKPLFHYLTGKVLSTDSMEFPASQSNTKFVDESRSEDSNLIPPKNERKLSKFSEARVLEGQDPMALLRAIERPIRDIDEMMECKGCDFYSILVAANKREEEMQRMEMQQRKDGLVAKRQIIGDDFGCFDWAKKVKMNSDEINIGEGLPLILVPSTSQALITIYNVTEFLEYGFFIPTEMLMNEMNGVRPECVTVEKKFTRYLSGMEYAVKDNPSALKKEDWDRVLAVFVVGKEGEFKDWPFKDHVEVFNKFLGFYMRFEDDSVESARNVKQWNVKIISISKNKRHQDRAAALEVWDRLEDFMRSRAHS